MTHFFRIFATEKEKNKPKVMKNNYTTERYYWRNAATRIILTVLTVALIVWFLPRNEVQHFRYDVGKPWMYGSFIANFDFPIYKTEEAVQEEKDSLTRFFYPYYKYDASVEQRQIKQFLQDYKDGLPDLSDSYRQLIVERLHSIYAAGIMDTPDYNRLYRDTTSQFRLINGKESHIILMRNVYSTMAAYEHLFADPRLQEVRHILQKCNLNEYVDANLIYDKNLSESEMNDLLSSISPASGMVMSGQKIIDRGEIVNEYTYRVLNSFEQELARRSASSNELASTVIGQTLFVGILVVLFTVYLLLFRHDYFEKPRSIMMLYLLLLLFPILVSLIMQHNFLSVYIVPFAIAPMFTRVFMDSRTAYSLHVIMTLICAAAVRYQYDFIIVQLVAGTVAIYSLRELSSRAQVFKSALLITLASMATYFSLQLMQKGEALTIDKDMYYHFLANGILLLLTYPLMYLVEKTFGFTSNVTLFELSNTNKGLLRDLSEIAPGTFQHSITVGNLAAEIANRIGANSLLVRTGALYHDIGKMTEPVFFTENQAGVNPHDNIPYSESARIVISHVTEGVKMAESQNLPTIIKDFILTHHGQGLAKYFYIKQQNEHPNEEIDKAPFTYPGPNPFTREQAILMMADTVEAASRSLNEYTEESISQLVNRLIDSQVSEGFFRDCPITFRDVAQAKAVLIERLKSIYHTRISYPELK